MPSITEQFMTLMNRINDSDITWWPVVKMRPARHQQITFELLIKLTLLFGVISGLVIAALEYFFLSTMHLVIDLLVGIILYYVICRVFFVTAWNWRAKQLEQD